MVAHHGTSTKKWRDSPLLPAVLIVSFFFLFQKYGLATMPQLHTFVMVDTLSESNWTQVELPNLSLSRVHHAGLLHHKIWILPFDEMWHMGLSQRSAQEVCAGAFGPVEAHVTSGASVASAASEVAGRVKRNRRVAPLLPLGRPFLLEDGKDREIVHVFAMLVQGVFSVRSKKMFERVVKPVQFVQQVGSIAKNTSVESPQMGNEEYCTVERAIWIARAVSYAMRRFKVKGFVPKSNPMDDASIDEAICCTEDIDRSEDLLQCGLKCDQAGLYNILAMFPQGR